MPAIAIGVSPWLLAMTIILSLIRGDLVPRRTHEGMITDRDKVIRAIEIDRDYYRDQTLALLRVADVAADRMTQALLTSRSPIQRPDLPRERGET